MLQMVMGHFAPILSLPAETACATIQRGNYSRLGCEKALYQQACNQGRRTDPLRVAWGCTTNLLDTVAATLDLQSDLERGARASEQRAGCRRNKGLCVE